MQDMIVRTLLMTAPDLTRSVRPTVTAELMAQTGLNDANLTQLVHGFYGRVRADALLAPIFADHISDWGPHLEKLVDFWSSVALMTGRYHGAPMPKHLPLPIEAEHFERWLELFQQTAIETCPPDGAALVIDRAHRIASSIHANIQYARSHQARADMPAQL